MAVKAVGGRRYCRDAHLHCAMKVFIFDTSLRHYREIIPTV